MDDEPPDNVPSDEGTFDWEFAEDEDPLSSGTPVYLEMPEHYGEAWWVYTIRHLRAFGQSGLAFLGLRDASSASVGPADEWLDDEIPNNGLPDLCAEYDLPPLPSPSDG